MQLNYLERGEGEPVVLLHGLFGSAANWHGIARRMQKRFHILAPDLRNHGRSPHDAHMDYPAMADDILELVDAKGLDQICLVGHSMGGKAAMCLALAQPQRIWGLVVADIAPVAYDHDFSGLLDALEAIPLESLDNRTAADQALAHSLASETLRGYLLQNLIKENGRWAWRVNLPVLRREMANIVGFPDQPQDQQFPGNALFLYGEHSDYLTTENAKVARRLFPYARLRMIPEAGHWVFSEAPEIFVDTLNSFLPG